MTPVVCHHHMGLERGAGLEAGSGEILGVQRAMPHGLTLVLTPPALLWLLVESTMLCCFYTTLVQNGRGLMKCRTAAQPRQNTSRSTFFLVCLFTGKSWTIGIYSSHQREKLTYKGFVIFKFCFSPIIFVPVLPIRV